MHDVAIDAAIYAHKMWFLRLRNAIDKGESDFKPEIVKTDNRCEFGKWLYGDFPQEFKAGSTYGEIKILHAKFHVEASKILELALKGDKKAAAKMLDDANGIKIISDSLIVLLDRLKTF